MSDAALFASVFGALLLFRIVAATVVFVLILPRGNRCPICDAVTVPLQSRFVRRLHIPLSKRWCLACGWDGYMRPDESVPAEKAEPNEQELRTQPRARPPSRKA